MSIVAASHQGAVLRAALQYLDCGLSVIPVRGKVCPIQWSRFQVERAAYSHLHNWSRAGLLQNVAVVCGSVSGKLVVIDLDGLEAVEHFERCFPHLLDTFTVISGSGQGKHLYFYTDEETPTTRTKGYELRSDGCYVVAPPSVHPVSGRQYDSNWTEVMRLNDLNEVRGWIEGMIRAKQPARVASNKPSICFEVTTAYGQSALQSAARNVAAAAARNRNNTLYIESLKLGSLVTDGFLSINEVEIALMRACEYIGLVNDDGERQCLATIKSGLRTGMSSSRKEWKKAR